jgi:hypothetical protein
MKNLMKNYFLKLHKLELKISVLYHCFFYLSERCSESSNANLKADLDKHRIPERLKDLKKKLSATHQHSEFHYAGYIAWANFGFFKEKLEEDSEDMNLLECVGCMSKWNHTGKILADVTTNVLLSPFFMGTTLLGTTFYTKALLAHAHEMNSMLGEVVAEIESLYKQTNSLVVANLL